MNKLETTQIITLLAGNFDNISKKDKREKEIMINTWYECLKDLDVKIVQQAVKIAIMKSPFQPTIADIRKNAIEIINPSEYKTAIEAWNEAYSMICHGNYMTEEQFKTASPEVQKFFGNVRQVAELARTDLDVVNTVTKGQFLKQYEVLVKREQEQKLLPQQMQDFTKQLIEKMNVKELGE